MNQNQVIVHIYKSINQYLSLYNYISIYLYLYLNLYLYLHLWHNCVIKWRSPRHNKYNNLYYIQSSDKLIRKAIDKWALLIKNLQKKK